MLLRLLRLGLLSLLFVHQTRPALYINEESVKELIVERSPGTYDLFTVNMKPNRTCGEVGSFLDTFCTTLGAHLLSYTFDRSSCKCECRNYQPFTFLSSKQRCANTNQVRDFGGEFSKHHRVNLYITEESNAQSLLLFWSLAGPYQFERKLKTDVNGLPMCFLWTPKPTTSRLKPFNIHTVPRATLRGGGVGGKKRFHY